ncbi:MAG: MFS transporter [Phycisphaerae bacterium]|nr:MFS transporter [Phycisphaerae bacterium]
MRLHWRRKSYEVLPALSIRGPELRKSLHRVTLAGMLCMAWLTIFAGSRATIFGRMLGFSNFDFGLFAALPFLATFGQLIAAVLIEESGLRKYQYMHFGVAHRALWLVVAAIPLFLPIPSRLAVWTMLITLAISWFFAALATPAWWSWMGDLIPRRIRGRYFAARQRWYQAVQILVVVVVGIGLQCLTRDDRPMTAETQPVFLWGLMGVFALGGICGIVDILLFRRIREVVPSVPHGPRVPAIRINVPSSSGGMRGQTVFAYQYAREMCREMLLDPMKDRAFRHVVLYLACMTAAITAAGPFYYLICLKTLGFTEIATDIVFLVVGPLVGIASAKILGRHLDRWGNRPVLVISTILTLFGGIFMLMASPTTPNPAFLVDGINSVSAAAGKLFGGDGWVWVDGSTPISSYLLILAGTCLATCGWTGVMLAQSRIMLDFADGQGRSKYLAASSVLISFGGVFGGLIGGWAAESFDVLQNAPIILGPFLWNNWHVVVLVSMSFRPIAMIWLYHMPKTVASERKLNIRQIRTNVYNFVNTRLFYRWRVYGWSNTPRPQRRKKTKDSPAAKNRKDKPTP